MLLGYLILGALVIWLSVEYFVTIRVIRVSSQAIIFLLVCVASIGFGSIVGRFSPTLEGNNQLKNLTRGLVTITSKVDFDYPLFQKQVKELNSNIVPTYENYFASRQALEDFLKAYDISYECEIPISD